MLLLLKHQTGPSALIRLAIYSSILTLTYAVSNRHSTGSSTRGRMHYSREAESESAERPTSHRTGLSRNFMNRTRGIKTDDDSLVMTNIDDMDDAPWSANFDGGDTQCMASCKSTSESTRLASSSAAWSNVADKSDNETGDVQRAKKHLVLFANSSEPQYNHCNGVVGYYWDTSFTSVISMYLKFTTNAVPNSVFVTICPKTKPDHNNVVYPVVPLTERHGNWIKEGTAQTSWWGWTYEDFYREDCDLGEVLDPQNDVQTNNTGTTFQMYSSGMNPNLYFRYVKSYGYVGDAVTGVGSYAPLRSDDIEVFISCPLFYDQPGRVRVF